MSDTKLKFSDLDTERVLVSGLQVSERVVFVRYGYVVATRTIMEIVNFHRSVQVIFDDGHSVYWEKLGKVDILVDKK